MLERGDDILRDSKDLDGADHEAADFRIQGGASALHTEGQEVQLPHLPAIAKNPIQNIKELLEMLPESGEISSSSFDDGDE